MAELHTSYTEVHLSPAHMDAAQLISKANELRVRGPELNKTELKQLNELLSEINERGLGHLLPTQPLHR